MSVAEATSLPAAKLDRIPPHAFFLVSAIFHYLGPSFAVLLFALVEPLGVAWLRIASAAVVFAIWRRPWRFFMSADRKTLLIVVALGAILAAMNAVFYLAIERMPLASVACIEFVATIGVALIGVRSARNLSALAVAVAGVYVLIGFAGIGDFSALAFAVFNAILFALYIVLGHASARIDKGSSIDRLAAAMLVAMVFAAPFGIKDASVAFVSPILLLAGLGVGLSSSVIPYVCDQLAMARLPRATFALMLALLPATAAIVGALVLRQIPSPIELFGIALVAVGIAIHKPAA
jgi:inner membrane transporter RhtA